MLGNTMASRKHLRESSDTFASQRLICEHCTIGQPIPVRFMKPDTANYYRYTKDSGAMTLPTVSPAILLALGCIRRPVRLEHTTLLVWE